MSRCRNVLCLAAQVVACCVVSAQPEADANGWVLELVGPPDPARLDELRDRFGLGLSDYAAGQGFLEYLPDTTARRLGAESDLRLRRFTPARRPPAPPSGDPEVWIRAIAWDANAARSLRGFIDRGADSARRNWGIVPEVPVSRLIEFPPRIGLRPRLIARIPAERWDEIRKRPEALLVEPLPPRVLDGDGSAGILQSGGGATPLWKRGLRGERQVVSVMDGGCIDYLHCWFEHVGQVPGTAHRKLRAARGRWIESHATFVGGIVAGDPLSAGDDLGHAPGACLVSVGDLTDRGAPVYPELLLACRQGARIHTNSWHEVWMPTEYRYSDLDQQIDGFLWVYEDHLVIGSAGNGWSTGPPGTAKNALSVAAARLPPPDGAHHAHGEGTIGPIGQRQKPDLVAPGCAVRSSEFVEDRHCDVGQRDCATSWSAPAVAGAAALVRQYFTDGWYPTGNRSTGRPMTPSGALLRAVLINAAQDMQQVSGHPSPTEGWGVVHLDRTLVFEDCDGAAESCAHELWVDDRRHLVGLDTGDSLSHDFKVGPGAPLRVTLAWTDAPGVAGVADPLVNDLDLSVTGPDGVTYRGGGIVDGESIPDGAADHRNTAEQVIVSSPAEGPWAVTVSAPAVYLTQPDRPRQGYALVVTGDLRSRPAPDLSPHFVESAFERCAIELAPSCPR